MPTHLLLFDLDGTLIDSRDDLADSVNLMLKALELENLPVETIYNYIGEGVYNLVARSITASLGKKANDNLVEKALEIFRRIYDRNCLNKTTLYPHVTETLQQLGKYEKAVITNKSTDFSLKILGALDIARYFEFVAGGDSFRERKPSGLPLLKVAESFNRPVSDCLMIGDSRVDIEAGKNAGIRTCGIISGFRGRRELVEAGADYLVENFADLTAILL